MSDDDKKLPAAPHGGFGGKRFMAGSQRSKRRLKSLKFDPIEKLTKLYARMEEEDEYYTELRKETYVVNMDEEGQTFKHRYSGVAHMALFANMEKVGNDLLRYAYGRVPETSNLNDVPASPMKIILSGDSVEPGRAAIVINPRHEEIEDAEYTES